MSRLSHTVPVPNARGPIPTTDSSYPFSTMRFPRQPFDLEKYGYVEEEYFLSGKANVYGFTGQSRKAEDVTIVEEGLPYTTRVLIRRPADEAPQTAWVSILNASQGYDVEDDWRRAWDYFISRRLAYVAVTAKSIQISALQTFDPERYADLTWGGKPRQLDASEDGWNPFVVLEDTEEGLAWDVLAQVSAWLHSVEAPITPENVFLIGQSQSAVYANTYLTYFHNILRLADGSNTFDGYAPGVGSLYVKELNQRGSGIPETLGESPDVSAPGTEALPAFVPYLVEPAQLDVPVISISSEADVSLFAAPPSDFRIGDGTMRRHWHVKRSPHSDARSRVIPDNEQVLRAKRLARFLDEDFLAELSALPLEPVVTGSMAAVEKWATQGVPAAASVWFDAESTEQWVTDESGLLSGGLELGLVANPIADFVPGVSGNPVLGLMKLHSRELVLERFPSFEDYRAACNAVDDELERAGYLEKIGRNLLHNVERELWERAVEGKPAPYCSPQQVVEVD